MLMLAAVVVLAAVVAAFRFLPSQVAVLAVECSGSELNSWWRLYQMAKPKKKTAPQPAIPPAPPARETRF